MIPMKNPTTKPNIMPTDYTHSVNAQGTRLHN